MLDQNNAQKAAQKTNTVTNSGTSGSVTNSGTSGSTGKNTAAPKKKVNIGCLLVIALIIGVIIFCVKGIPQIRFNNAVKMFESGDDGWEELIEDLNMQPEMLEVIDARAKDLVDAGYVAEALDVMSEGMRINGLYWKERDAVAQEAALEAYSYGNYADACYYYNEMSEPDTSTEAYNHSHYVLGLQEIEVGDRDNVWNPYMNAAECLEKCSHYYDVSERILYAKYRCVSISLDREDPTLVTYMEDLMAAGYPGAQELYDDFYRWGLDPLGINSNQDDTETNLDTIGVNDPVYFHFMPTGGPPDGLVAITAHYRLPDGTEKSHAFSSEWSAGAHIWFGWHEGIYEEGDQKVAGTLTVDFYAQNGKIMGSMSVEMVE